MLVGQSPAGTEFALDRVYVNVDWRLWENAAFKLNLEGGDFRDKDYSLNAGGALASKDGVFNVKTRAAYLEVTDLWLPTLVLQVGQVGLPWLGYSDALWGYRVLGTSFLDRGGYLSSVDSGITVGAKIPAGLGDWQLSVVNGEGWKSPELGFHKDYHARLTLLPLAPWGLNGLFLSAAGSVGAYDPPTTGASNERNRFILQVGCRNPGQFLLAADALVSATDPADKMVSRYPSLSARGTQLATATGISIYGTLNLGLADLVPALRPVELIARVDQLDPDTQTADNGLIRQLYGVSYTWHPSVTTTLAYEVVAYQKSAMLKDDQRGMLSTEVRY